VGVLVATALLTWRMLHVEATARTMERDRAHLLAERILRLASQSSAVVERLPPARQFVVRDGVVTVDPDVGWIATAPAASDVDVVVADRLDRAARAEFGAGDFAAARHEYYELLRAPLPSEQRLVVLGAAAWFHVRRGEAVAHLLTELDQRIGALDPASFGRAVIANAVAAAARLPRPPEAGAIPWLDRCVPLLPKAIGVGLPESVARPLAAARVAERREVLAQAAAAWRHHAPSAPRGLVALGGGEVMCWIDDGAVVRRGACVPITMWLDAVRAAGRDGALPEWPWIVEPDVEPDTDAPFAGVPHLRGVVARAGSLLQEHTWLLPAVAVLLFVAFGAAALQQRRASRREAAAVRAQAEFSTTVTHELRTPLAAIRLLAEMLADGRARGREAEYYGMLVGEAARLSMLIENVLDLGRIERGERAQDPRPVELSPVVDETLALFTPLAHRDGLRVEWRDELPTAQRVVVDRGGLVQALVCVLDNARKYGAAGGVVEVVAARDGSRVLLRIRDRGPGVPEDERERIFDRFVRGSAHAHGSTPGVGIGLYLARAIVRRMGGDLVCERPDDGGPGACFTMSLPEESSA